MTDKDKFVKAMSEVCAALDGLSVGDSAYILAGALEFARLTRSSEEEREAFDSLAEAARRAAREMNRQGNNVFKTRSKNGDLN